MRDEDGRLFSLPAGWTDAAAGEPVRGDRGRPVPVHRERLLAVAELIDRLDAGRAWTVLSRKITP